MSYATKMFSAFLEHSFVLLVATVVLSTFAFYSHFRVRRVLDSLPLARKELGSAYARRTEFLKDPMKAYREGYEKFRGKAFRVTHYEGERIVLPTSALDELWNAPETILNKNRAYDQKRVADLCGTVHFTESVMGAIHILQPWSGWFRPIAQYFKSERAQLAKSWKHLKSSKKLLIPMIQQRREDVKAGRASYNDMLAWMMAKAEKWEQSDDDLAGSLVQLGVAATHNTSMTVTQTLYQLAIRPSLVHELRDEIRGVVAAFNGELTPVALYEMKLLDSVMKEAQRLNPTTPSHFHRYMEKTHALKDGTVLPAGTTIEAIFAPVLFDPSLFPNPEHFDPYRFLKLRTGESPDPNHYSNKEQYAFSHATKDNLVWGYGAHACPGRYFANNEIKLILARMLLRYDVRMPGGSGDIYKPQRAGMGWTPDLRKPIEFRAVRRGI